MYLQHNKTHKNLGKSRTTKKPLKEWLFITVDLHCLIYFILVRTGLVAPDPTPSCRPRSFKMDATTFSATMG